MNISNFEDALYTLNVERDSPIRRERAIKYLAHHPNYLGIERLVQALQDDDFGVRWQASLALAGLGKDAFVALLGALIDPYRVGDPRLRAGAYRVLEHMNPTSPPPSIRRLMTALKGPAADILSMEAAFQALQDLKSEEREVNL